MTEKEAPRVSRRETEPKSDDTKDEGIESPTSNDVGEQTKTQADESDDE